MKETQFPKSFGQRFYEDCMKTITKIAASFTEMQLEKLMETAFDIQRENIKQRDK